MDRRLHTADDVLRLARTGATELVVAPGDRLTPLARDVASEHRVKLHDIPQVERVHLRIQDLLYDGQETRAFEDYEGRGQQETDDGR